MKIPGIAFARGWANSFEVKGKTSINEYASFLGWNFAAIIGLFLASYRSYVPTLTPFIYLAADILPITSLTLRRLNDAEEPWSKLFNRKALKQNPRKERLQWHTNFITRDLPELPGAILCSMAVFPKAETGFTIIILVSIGISLIASNLPILAILGILILAAAALIAYYTKIYLDSED